MNVSCTGLQGDFIIQKLLKPVSHTLLLHYQHQQQTCWLVCEFCCICVMSHFQTKITSLSIMFTAEKYDRDEAKIFLCVCLHLVTQDFQSGRAGSSPSSSASHPPRWPAGQGSCQSDLGEKGRITEQNMSTQLNLIFLLSLPTTKDRV